MNESHNKPLDIPRTSFDVPGLTEEEIQARVLHRDGLMLVIDKPAGMPVHQIGRASCRERVLMPV